MKKLARIVFVTAAYLAITPSGKPLDPATIIVSALVGTGVNKTVDGLIYLFSSSKSDKDYAASYERLRFFTKQNFIEDFRVAFSVLKHGALDILVQHELYKHPNFIEAVKETFPEYPEYIKALMPALNDNPKARLVRGFETDHLYHKGAGIFRKGARDFSEFYELIKKLYAEVLAQEQRLKALQIIKTTQANASHE